jgi:signal transduction histidine kinase
MLTINDYETLLHEIKNAVSVVSCSLQLIEKQHPTVKDYAFWKDTASDLSGLRTLLIDVADTHLCNLPQKKNVNIDQFLQEVKAACPKACDAKHPLLITIEPGLSDGFFDAFRIRHALLRILDNAFDALYEEGFVQLNAFSNGHGIVFEVKDDGKGIAREALPQICQPFFGSGNGKNGLGLFISKGIVDSHNGTLSIDSEWEKGTTVTIFLPFSEDQDNGNS